MTSSIFVSITLCNGLLPDGIASIKMDYFQNSWEQTGYFNQNALRFVQEYAFHYVACKTSTIFLRPQCVALTFHFVYTHTLFGNRFIFHWLGLLYHF